MQRFGRQGRMSLRQGLDRNVYQIAKKFEDERAEQQKDGKRVKLTVNGVYDYIKKSNSSLSRQKRKPLEESIERVLQFRKEESSDSEDDEEILDIEGVESKSDRFILNRQITKHWHSNPSSSVPSARGSEGKSTKKRRLSLELQLSDSEDQGTANGHEAREGSRPAATSDGSIANPHKRSSAGRASKSNGTKPAAEESQSAVILPKAPKPSKYVLEHVPEGSIVLGGYQDIARELREIIFSQFSAPLEHLELYYGERDHGVVLHGPPGTGKKSLVRALAAETRTPVIPLATYLDATAPVEKVAKIIEDVFEEAKRNAPCVILIEHLHSHTSRPGSNQTDFDRQFTSQLRKAMKKLGEWRAENRTKAVVAIGTTSKIETIDPTLLADDIFPFTVNIKVPDTKSREEIIKVLTRDLDLPEDFDHAALAMQTHGFVGKDIAAVVRSASRTVWQRNDHSNPTTTTFDDSVDATMRYAVSSHQSESIDDTVVYQLPTSPPQVTYKDFEDAIKKHTPHMRQEGFSTIPSTTWAEVGALHDVRDAFEYSIVRPIKEPLLFQQFGIRQRAGVLLFGPPGCGKTLVAKAVANDAQASFILIKGPELLNKYVGESERAIRELFTRAKSCAPCILFFDEMDSLVPRREKTSTEAGARVVNALLTELDGAEDREGVYVIGTSNRPDMIDPAILRPGRLDKLLFVDLPSEDERVDILKTICVRARGEASAEDLQHLEAVARDPRCGGFSGADLQGLYDKAIQRCIKRYRGEGGDSKVKPIDWEFVLQTARPSVSNPESYRKLAAKLGTQD